MLVVPYEDVIMFRAVRPFAAIVVRERLHRAAATDIAAPQGRRPSSRQGVVLLSHFNPTSRQEKKNSENHQDRNLSI
jgi:hypothetical protein